MSSKLSVCLWTAIIDFTVFVLLTLELNYDTSVGLIEETTVEEINFEITTDSSSKPTYTDTTRSTSATRTTSTTTTTRRTTTAPMITLDSNMVAAAGDWYPWEFCLDNSFAIGFNLKIDKNTIDNTALNTIKLICNDFSRTPIVSYDGFRGVWGKDVYCPANKRIIGFRYRYDDYAGPLIPIDDSSGNSIYFYCEDNTEIRPTLEGYDGDWTSIKTCPSGYAVCGLIVQYQADQGTVEKGDDTALNNLQLKCCKI